MHWHRLGLTYSAVASLAAAGLLTLRGEWIAPTVLSVVALVMVMVRFGIDADLRGLVASITPRRERVGGVLVAGLLVTAALGAPLAGSPVGPAAATHDCTETQRLATFSFGLGGYAADKFLFDGKCTESHRAEAIQTMEESDANQTHLDIYNAALEQDAQTATETAIYDNYLNDTEASAWMQAEMAIAEAYQNGSSKAVAKSKARQAIAEYYVVKQKNLIESWNQSAASLNTTISVAENESELTARNVVWPTGDYYSTGGNDYVGDEERRLVHPDRQGTVTLVDGSTASTWRIGAEFYMYSGTSAVAWATPETGTAYKETYDSNYNVYAVANATGYKVLKPNDNYDDLQYIWFNDYKSRWDRIEEQNNALQDEVDPFVNNTWEAYQSGQIDASDVLSRNTQMFRYGQSAVNGTNSTYDVVAALSSMGLDSPELNGTGTMEVQYKGATYNGFLMARNAPNGSWQAGTTYNTSNIDGPVLLAHTGGDTKELDGEFTVSSITSESGDEITEVKTTKIVYKTSNTSEQLEKMNRILELREEIESREPKPGGGGTSGGGDGPLQALAAALGIGVGAVAAIVAVVGLIALKVYSP
ncbi:hypothetical protein [Halobaculum rarum]|uniref:hypothetical protein n=1 Tax=Halobaculum rarum TaxID=3075122 RepID=UPI0032AFE9BD